MHEANGVAYDGVHDRLFVADHANNRVLVFNTATITDGMNAAYVLGQADFTHSTPADTQAGMSDPEAAAYDPLHDRLFVADASNRRVTVYDTSSLSNGKNASNVIGQSSYTTNAASLTQSGMSTPYGVAYDPSSNYLYVADGTYSRTTIYNLASISNGMNASYVLGQSDYTTSTGTTTATGEQGCNDVAISGTMIYVADSNNHRVIGYPKASLATGMAATMVYGQANFTTGTGSTTRTTMSTPWGVDVDSTSGRLFVTDAGNNRLLEFNIDNAPMEASLAQYKSDGTTSVATGGWNNSTTAVLKATGSDVDTADTLSVCVEAQPIATAFTNVESACGSAVSPGAVATQTLSSLTEGGEYHWQACIKDSMGAYSAWSSYGGNSDTVTVAVDFISAVGLPADYVFGQGGSYTTSAHAATSTALYMSSGSYTDIDSVHHRLFVADEKNNRVLEYNLDSTDTPSDATADHVLGQTTMTGSGTGTTASTMNNPQGLAYDPVNDRLFVVDCWNSRVLVFNTSTITDGMNAANVLGQANFTSGGTATTQAGLSNPVGASFDRINNRLFVADYSNGRTIVYNTSSITDGMNAAYVLGQPNFITGTGGTTQAKQNNPCGVDYDPSSNYLYVADYGNNRSLVYNLASIANGMKRELRSRTVVVYDKRGDDDRNG